MRPAYPGSRESPALTVMEVGSRRADYEKPSVTISE
jgi:hypothetical protein